MSHFYGNMKGSRGEVTRCGTKWSGHTCHIRGWNSGVKVVASHNEVTGKDEFQVFRTGGSNDPGGRLVATVVED